VKKELPRESEDFIGIDKEMKDIMAKGCKVLNVRNFCTIDGMNKRLEVIEI
jgi:dynein heavy chain